MLQNTTTTPTSKTRRSIKNHETSSPVISTHFPPLPNAKFTLSSHVGCHTQRFSVAKNNKNKGNKKNKTGAR